MTRLTGPAELRLAERHLASADAVLQDCVERLGPCGLAPWEREPFGVLIRSVVGQQLSVKAAGTIHARVEALLGGPANPQALAVADPEALRGCGLSAAKTKAVRGIAAAVQGGQCDLVALGQAEDDAALAALMALPGVGRWTAEMFLIFALGHADVLALGDAGLRRAACRVYGLTELADTAFTQLAEPWRPWRSVASWYLWRSLDSAEAAATRPPGCR